MRSEIGNNFTDADVTNYLWKTLKSGQVVPGYGHAVLRKPDPRFEALMGFASARPEIAENPLFQLVKKNSEIAPKVLMEHGKVRFSTYRLVWTFTEFVPPHRPKIPTRTSTPLRASSSTTTASTRPCTIP